MRKLFVPLLLATLCVTAYAEEKPGEPLPPPPLPPADAPGQNQDQGLQPEVTIKQRGADVIEEYRVNGRLYMVKITPSKGYPYYLIDTNGDGNFDTRRNELDPPNVNRWILFRW